MNFGDKITDETKLLLRNRLYSFLFVAISSHIHSIYSIPLWIYENLSTYLRTPGKYTLEKKKKNYSWLIEFLLKFPFKQKYIYFPLMLMFSFVYFPYIIYCNSYANKDMRLLYFRWFKKLCTNWAENNILTYSE